jgi:VCBS repeat-containing protein
MLHNRMFNSYYNGFDSLLANDTDADGDTLIPTYVPGNGPYHGILEVLDPSNGHFQYVPNPGYVGTDTFNYKIFDGAQYSSVATVTLSVTNHAPVAQPESYSMVSHLTFNSYYNGFASVLANDTDADGDAIVPEYLPASGPTHGIMEVFDVSNGHFQYIPNPTYAGTDSFQYRIFDGTYYSAPITVTLNIAVTTQPPVAQPDAYTMVTNLTFNSFYNNFDSVLANDTDADGDALTPQYLPTSGPSHGFMEVFDVSNGHFQYIPSPGYAGTDTFQYRVSDGTYTSAPATVTLSIKGASNNSYTVLENATATGNLLTDNTGSGVDSDPSLTTNNPITVSAVNGATEALGTAITLPSGALLTVNSDGTFSYNASTSATFNALPVGATATDSFTYQISNGNGGFDTATVTWTITGANDSPIALNDEYYGAGGTPATTEDELFSVPLPGPLANDTDPDSDLLTVNPLTTTSFLGAQVDVQANGQFSYDPRQVPVIQALGTGQSLLDHFSYTITDGQGGTATATVTISVGGINDAPKALNDEGSIGNQNLTTNEDSILGIDSPGVLANDTDPENDPLSLANYGSPSEKGAFVVVHQLGDITYIPGESLTLQALAAGETTTDTFFYSIKDSNNQVSLPAFVTVVVHGVNDAPRAVDDAFRATPEDLNIPLEDTPFRFNVNDLLANDEEIDHNDTISFVSFGQPSNGTIALDEGSFFIYTPRLNFSGWVTIPYTIQDTQGATNSANLHIKVENVNDAPVFLQSVPANLEIVENAPDGAIVGYVLADDADYFDHLSFSITGGNTDDAFLMDHETGLITVGNSNALDFETQASFTLTIAVSDNGTPSLSTTAQITVGILEANEPPTNISLSVDTLYEKQVVNTVIGAFTATDPDTDDVFSFDLVYGPGSEDNALFVVDGNSLLTNAVLNYSEQSEYHIRVRVTDAFGNRFSKPFTITLINVNDAPVLQDPGIVYVQFEEPLLINPFAWAEDEDLDPLTSQLIVSPQHGQMSAYADGTWTYLPAAGYLGPDSLTVRVNDGLLDSNDLTVNLEVYQVVVWDGGGDGANWSDPVNWDHDQVPGYYSHVIIGPTYQVNLEAATNASIRSLDLQGTLVVHGSLQIRATTSTVTGAMTVNGTLTVANTARMNITGTSSFLGTVNLQEGTELLLSSNTSSWQGATFAGLGLLYLENAQVTATGENHLDSLSTVP